jgi:hypothetical protein
MLLFSFSCFFFLLLSICLATTTTTLALSVSEIPNGTASTSTATSGPTFRCPPGEAPRFRLAPRTVHHRPRRRVVLGLALRYGLRRRRLHQRRGAARSVLHLDAGLVASLSHHRHLPSRRVVVSSSQIHVPRQNSNRCRVVPRAGVFRSNGAARTKRDALIRCRSLQSRLRRAAQQAHHDAVSRRH